MNNEKLVFHLDRILLSLRDELKRTGKLTKFRDGEMTGLAFASNLIANFRHEIKPFEPPKGGGYG